MSFLSSLMNALPGAVAQGLAWGIMAIGVYITFRILDVADLTVDGSLATGGAVCVMLIRAGVDPWLAMLCDLGLGLETRLSSEVSTLSGGQRQALTLLMASLQKPKLLLLDEHTAALDPATAAKVLELSDKIVAENGLTAMMITHNMKDAIKHGNRLIMMNEGRIILDISGEEKQKLTKRDLMDKFAEIAGMQVESDQVLLTR